MESTHTTEMLTRDVAADSAPLLYLELLRKCLTRYGLEPSFRHQPYVGRNFLSRLVPRVLRRASLEVCKSVPVDAHLRLDGRDWPPEAETMVGLRRLENVQSCMIDVLQSNVPGDFIETGVWRGGTTIFMRGVLKAFSVLDRCVWVADSFQGLPKPDADRYPADRDDPHWTFRELAVSLEGVKANFERYGLLDDQVRFLQGWFRDTLPGAPISRLAVLRLDGDMYESTMDALTSLYDKVSPGGYVIIDDYGAIPGCRSAVDDFRNAHTIDSPLIKVDWTGVYWRKP